MDETGTTTGPMDLSWWNQLATTITQRWVDIETYKQMSINDPSQQVAQGESGNPYIVGKPGAITAAIKKNPWPWLLGGAAVAAGLVWLVRK